MDSIETVIVEPDDVLECMYLGLDPLTDKPYYDCSVGDTFIAYEGNIDLPVEVQNFNGAFSNTHDGYKIRSNMKQECTVDRGRSIAMMACKS